MCLMMWQWWRNNMDQTEKSTERHFNDALLSLALSASEREIVPITGQLRWKINHLSVRTWDPGSDPKVVWFTRSWWTLVLACLMGRLLFRRFLTPPFHSGQDTEPYLMCHWCDDGRKLPYVWRGKTWFKSILVVVRTRTLLYQFRPFTVYFTVTVFDVDLMSFFSNWVTVGSKHGPVSICVGEHLFPMMHCIKGINKGSVE